MNLPESFNENAYKLLEQYEFVKTTPKFTDTKKNPLENFFLRQVKSGDVHFEDKQLARKSLRDRISLSRRKNEYNFLKNADKVKKWFNSIKATELRQNPKLLERTNTFIKDYNLFLSEVIQKKYKQNFFQKFFKLENSKALSAIATHTLTEITTKTIDPKDEIIAVFSRKKTSLREYAQVISTTIRNNDTLHKKVEDFRNTYGDITSIIQKSSWNALKKSLATKMATEKFGKAGKSLEEFRNLANELVNTITIELGKSLGLSPISWSACGTVGYNSDVDTAIAEKNIPIHEACLYKSLRDTIHVAIFGEPSGLQLDTESYIPHISTLDTLKSLLEITPKSEHNDIKQRFYTYEFANMAFQRNISLSKHPKDYQESKNKDLESITDPQQKEALKHIYTATENYLTEIQKQIRDTFLMNLGSETQYQNMSEDDKNQLLHEALKKDGSGKAYKLAREATVISLRINLSEETKKIENDIKKTTDIKKLQQLHLDKNRLYILINLLQDEGTMSQSEGFVTLFAKEGQIYQGALKKERKKLQETLKNQEIDRILVTEYYNNADREQLPSGFTDASPEQLLFAAYEEEAQFRHVINDGLHANDHKKAIINAGKYCLRTTSNTLAALEKIQKKLSPPLPEKFEELLKKTQDLTYRAQQLEMCKRKFHLSDEAVISMLTTRIKKINNITDEQESIQLRKKVTTALTTTKNDTFKTIFTKREAMALFAEELDHARVFNTQKNSIEKKKTTIQVTTINKTAQSSEDSTYKAVVSKNPTTDKKINEILMGFAGYSKEKKDHQNLIELHNRGTEITLENLGLTSKEAISKFADEIEENGQNVRNMLYNLVLPTASPTEAQNLNFLTHL